MKIICIGRNYADHAKEMNAPLPTVPMFFMKPDVALLKNGNPFYYPEFSKDIHYECELVVRISKAGKNIAEKFAHNYYSEIGLGIDFTARDLQQLCKEKGQPWEIAKSFEASAPISERFIPIKELDLSTLEFSLDQNGKRVQTGHAKDMIFGIDQLIAYVSRFMTLKTGDLIYTGTPQGVGPIAIGDVLIGKIGTEEMFRLEVK
ncbi:MAG: 2-hydroxyhepta-2,4-diene-1,7-dioate isomerase [Bacteroidetes bacterium RIFCSPHIGHO2_02_FULL_44_7]|nr:MAG: 2-hydroxyhepta-2,4-diene-1,7-dioate isomerase [Bacteroidetes bacterium RIFCSPHIGHO2_02_FULL_44_7]